MEKISQTVKSNAINIMILPILVVMMLAMMILPLPPFLLDLLFTFNIALSLIVLLAVVYCLRPLDFAVFPIILLLATLLRLSLNVASTRIVLLYGHTGTDAAGQVIKSFGDVVIGGNYTVGLVVFFILIIINFVVVTKGASRVSEVSARFTLDALPGKQIAIDSDVNAGLITQEEAKKLRDEVSEEADFYGAMDGASKFVRGDAIAGIFILLINMVGGLIIGIIQKGLPISDAMHNYALLTVGDGLVAQIPSLLLSTAAAIMVTRLSRSQNIGDAVFSQLLSNTKALIFTATVISILGLVPGMPHIAFFTLAGLIYTLAYFVNCSQDDELFNAEPPKITKPQRKNPRTLQWDDIKPVESLLLEVGFRLLPMIDERQNSTILTQLHKVRKKLSQQYGFIIPAICIRDNIDLAQTAYRITLGGVVWGKGEILPEKMLAINSLNLTESLDGIKTTDPAFGFPAVWIRQEDTIEAQNKGYMVVDSSTVIVTHMSQLMEKHIDKLLGYEETLYLIKNLEKSYPQLMASVKNDNLSINLIHQVLQQLLEDKIPLTDMRTIVETLSQNSSETKDPEVIASELRLALRRLIVQNISGLNKKISIIELQPELEQLLQKSINNQDNLNVGMANSMIEKIQASLSELSQKSVFSDQPAILVTHSSIRKVLARLIQASMPNMHVLSYQEIPPEKQLNRVGILG